MEDDLEGLLRLIDKVDTCRLPAQRFDVRTALAVSTGAGAEAGVGVGVGVEKREESLDQPRQGVSWPRTLPQLESLTSHSRIFPILLFYCYVLCLLGMNS